MKALIVVDMQKDFVNGSLGTKEAQAIVSKVQKKIEDARAQGKQIIFTRDTHPVNYMETYEGKHLPVEHCIEGSDGWKVDRNLTVDPEKDIVLNKPTFGYLGWKEYDFEEVEMIGLCTDICVISNALIIRAMYPDIDITVDASCCAGVTVETHQAALATMKMCQIQVTNEA
ncbi:MAG: cysteine hydrolase [Lachnospiraceae bacterium]|nr:cysteine hydrolase [Lachnospiraceae bacterium]